MCNCSIKIKLRGRKAKRSSRRRRTFFLVKLGFGVKSQTSSINHISRSSKNFEILLWIPFTITVFYLNVEKMKIYSHRKKFFVKLITLLNLVICLVKCCFHEIFARCQNLHFLTNKIFRQINYLACSYNAWKHFHEISKIVFYIFNLQV